MNGNRREFLGQVAGAAALGMAGAGAMGPSNNDVNPPPPNIIHIISHDMGAHLGCYNRKVATPNFDRLAARGIRFQNYFCTAPQCSPSRGSILTGLYPHRNGLIGLSHIGWTIRSDVKTMPQYLNELGYETYLVGGHHEALIEAEGYEARLKEARSLGYRHYLSTAELDQWDTFHYIGSCYRRLEENVESIRGSGRPFFLNIGTHGAHRPFQESKWGVRYEADKEEEVEIPAYLPDRKGIREDIAFLNGQVKREDEFVGKMLELFENQGMLENTLVVLTTDHGIAMPRAKGMLYDPGIENYLIMYMKGRFEGGKSYPELLSNVDLLPTYLELAGGRVPDGLDGRSFLALLEGRDYERRAHIFAEITWHDRYNPSRAVRTGRFKYIRNFGRRPRVYLPLDTYTGRAGDCMFQDCYYFMREAEEFYDLESDPREMRNRVDDPCFGGEVDRLRGMVEKWMQGSNDPLVQGDVPPTRRQLERITNTVYFN
jgi:N-sulfoglucosamine sulfohydrolase